MAFLKNDEMVLDKNRMTFDLEKKEKRKNSQQLMLVFAAGTFAKEKDGHKSSPSGSSSQNAGKVPAQTLP